MICMSYVQWDSEFVNYSMLRVDFPKLDLLWIDALPKDKLFPSFRLNQRRFLAECKQRGLCRQDLSSFMELEKKSSLLFINK